MIRTIVALVLLIGLAACEEGPTEPTDLTSDTPLLVPATPVITSHFSGTVTPTTTGCSSPGVHNLKPCVRHQFSSSGSGPITITLQYSWPSGSAAPDLDVELWAGNTRLGLTVNPPSGGSTTSTEKLTVEVLTANNYEVRVYYQSGSAGQAYEVDASHPQ
jgi:hypothetical protein